jgi:hypothetical protein
MAIAEAAAVVTTLKSASELVDRLRKSEDRNTLRAGIDALTEMLINARMSALDLIQEKEALLDRVNVLERQADIAVEFGDKSENTSASKCPPECLYTASVGRSPATLSHWISSVD